MQAPAVVHMTDPEAQPILVPEVLAMRVQAGRDTQALVALLMKVQVDPFTRGLEVRHTMVLVAPPILVLAVHVTQVPVGHVIRGLAVQASGVLRYADDAKV
jgi:hypothetical protein